MRVIAVVAWAMALTAAQPAQEPGELPDFGTVRKIFVLLFPTV